MDRKKQLEKALEEEIFKFSGEEVGEDDILYNEQM
jgi:hypothetical protein